MSGIHRNRLLFKTFSSDINNIEIYIVRIRLYLWITFKKHTSYYYYARFIRSIFSLLNTPLVIRLERLRVRRVRNKLLFINVPIFSIHSSWYQRNPPIYIYFFSIYSELIWLNRAYPYTGINCTVSFYLFYSVIKYLSGQYLPFVLCPQ